MPPAVAIEGLAQLSVAFARADRQLQRNLRAELLVAGLPVSTDAEQLAVQEISGLARSRLTPRTWDKMRVGATRHMVYVAPRQRGKKGRHRRVSARRHAADQQFAGRLLTEAMEPALERNRAQVIARLEFMLEVIARDWGRGG